MALSFDLLCRVAAYVGNSAPRCVSHIWDAAFASQVGNVVCRGAASLRRAVRGVGARHATGVCLLTNHEHDTAVAWQWSAPCLWGERDSRLVFSGPAPTVAEVAERLHGHAPRFRGFEHTARWQHPETVETLDLRLDGATYGRRGLRALQHIFDVPWPLLRDLRVSAVELGDVDVRFKDYREVVKLAAVVVRRAPQLRALSVHVLTYYNRGGVFSDFIQLLRERPLERVSLGLRKPEVH